MKVEVPGSATQNPPNEIRIRQVEDKTEAGPSESVRTKQDPGHTREKFEQDLDRATERVKEQPS
jgi:hypothetical protein